MPYWLLYLMLALATASVTRLAVSDKIPPVGWARKKIVEKLDPRDKDGRRIVPNPERIPTFRGVAGRGWRMFRYYSGRSFAYLITCPWCMSVWLGTGLTFAVTLFTSVPLPWVSIAVSRYVTGWLADLNGWGEQQWENNLRRQWTMDAVLKKDHGLEVPGEDD